LQNWGGIPHPKGMIAEKLPEVRYFFADMPSRRQKQEETELKFCI
jgi:hypothetical protein